MQPVLESKVAPYKVISGAEPDVEIVLQKLTLQEKTRLLTGDGMWASGGVPRLGLSPLRMSDGPHGARGRSTCGDDGVVLVPCELALAATFNEALIEEIGSILGAECVRRGADVLLGPCLNLQRFPESGRHFECFSEDPFLAGRAAVSYVLGVQRQGVVSCVKHFVCNDQEDNRGHSNSVVDERTLREVYLAPFEAAVVEGGAQALMCGYNRVNNIYCTEHPILQKVLREEWGFKGVVMSDWWGNRSTEQAITAGLNIEMPGIEPMNFGGYLVNAVQSGRVSVDIVNERCRSVLHVHLQGRRNRDGDIPPFAQEEVLQRASREACVLLKNEHQTLPLNAQSIRKVAVVGPNASNTVLQGGGSSRVHVNRSQTILEALQEALGPLGVQVLHGEGCTWEHRPKHEITLEIGGLMAMADCDASGQPMKRSRMSSTAFNDKVLDVAGFLSKRAWFRRCFMPALRKCCGWRYQTPEEVCAMIAKDQAKKPKVVSGPRNPQDDTLLRHAELLASEADSTILVLGTHGFWELEGVDQSHSSLLGRQDELVKRCVAASRGPVIVVLNVGSPKELPWLSEVPAVLLAHFGGQAMSGAVVDLLFGVHSPSGKLPTTWPSAAGKANFKEDLKSGPGVVQPLMTARQDTGAQKTDAGSHAAPTMDVVYGDGLAFGYRGLKGIGPLFPFGHGLSYTRFEYSSLQVKQIPSLNSAPGPRLEVCAVVRNVGQRAGAEVAQLYITTKGSGQPADLPPSLRGFCRSRVLSLGQEERLRFIVSARHLSSYDVDAGRWQEPPDGSIVRIFVGASSQDIRLTQDFALKLLQLSRRVQ